MKTELGFYLRKQVNLLPDKRVIVIFELFRSDLCTEIDPGEENPLLTRMLSASRTNCGADP
jgi:hypothetical protein